MNENTMYYKECILAFLRTIQIIVDDPNSDVEVMRLYILENLKLIRTYLDAIE